jgi:hypothetical protein
VNIKILHAKSPETDNPLTQGGHKLKGDIVYEVQYYFLLHIAEKILLEHPCAFL